MHTTIVFSEDSAHETLSPVAGVRDQHMRVIGDDIYVPVDFNKIVAAGALGWALQEAKLVAPSLAVFFNPWIEPDVSFAAAAHDLQTMLDLKANPISLATNEALNAQVRVGEDHPDWYPTVIVNLASGPLTPVAGEIFSMKMIGTVTGVIGVWTNTTLTLPVDLPVGRYQVVGARCYSNYCGAFRLVPVGERYRPGGMMFEDTRYADEKLGRFGAWGVWCEFDQLTPPSLEICPRAAATWYSLVLDLIKV